MPLTAYQKEIVGIGRDVGLYYPLDALQGVGDLSARRHDGERSGEVTIGGLSPGPVSRDGRTGTTFDGVNDSVLTNWQTRTNLATNPIFLIDLTDWTKDNASATLEAWELSTAWQPASLQSLYVKAKATAGSAQMRSWSKTSGGSAGFPVTAGQQYTVVGLINVLTLPALAPKFYLRWMNAANATISDSSGAAATVLGPQVVSATFTAPAEATSVHLMFGHYNQGNLLASGEVTEHLIGGVLLEQASSAGSFFPSIDLLSTEEAGWTGTEGKSTSQLGPLANGTIRTFTAWVNPSGAATRGLWGRSNNDGLWITLAGALRWRANGVDETWTTALSNGRWSLLGHVFDTRADLSTIYVNGAPVETKANANPYSTAASAQFVLGQSLGAFYNGGMAHFALMFGDFGAQQRTLWRMGSGL